MPRVVDRSEATLQAIDRVSPAAKHQRADFIRRAVKNALFQVETQRMREAYRLQPDTTATTEHGIPLSAAKTI